MRMRMQKPASMTKRARTQGRVAALTLSRANEVLRKLLESRSLATMRVALAPIRDTLAERIPATPDDLRVYSLALALTDSATSEGDQAFASSLAIGGDFKAALLTVVDALLIAAGMPADEPRRLVALYALVLKIEPEKIDLGQLRLWSGAHVAPNPEHPELPGLGFSRAHTAADRKLAEDLLARVRAASGSPAERPAPWSAGGGPLAKARVRLGDLLNTLRADEALTYAALAREVGRRPELRELYAVARPGEDPNHVDPRWVRDQCASATERAGMTAPRATKSHR
jgi:hypothetical protein